MHTTKLERAGICDHAPALNADLLELPHGNS